MKLAFAGWGTGGHVMPIKNLVEYIGKKDRKIEIFWFWEKNSLEEKAAIDINKALWDVHFIPIMSWKIRRYWSVEAVINNILDIFKIVVWFFQSIYYIKKYKIEKIFSKWWYVSIPPAIAWKLLGKTIYLHESDTVSWLANRIVWKFCNYIFLWFESSKKYFNPKKNIYGIYVVWQILSDKFYNQNISSKTTAGTAATTTTNLLIIWWSQWSQILIKTLHQILSSKKSIAKKFIITIIWWTKNIWCKQLFDNYNNITFHEFVSQAQMIDILSNTDISITRWWATSLAEQSIFDIHMIIIPLPYTWGNHQYRNALEYKKQKHWTVILQDNNIQSNLANALNNMIWFKKKHKAVKIKNNKDFIYHTIVTPPAPLK